MVYRENFRNEANTLAYKKLDIQTDESFLLELMQRAAFANDIEVLGVSVSFISKISWRNQKKPWNKICSERNM